MPPAAAVVGAVAPIAGQVGGGLFGKKSAKKAAAARQAAIAAAKTQITTSLGDSNKQLSDYYEQGREDLQNYQDIGDLGLSRLSDPNTTRNFQTSDFYTDPGYQFVLDQGQRGIQNLAAGKGSLLSGATLKALERFNQNTASNQYQSSFDRFNQNRGYQTETAGGMAGMGQNAANTVGGWGQTSGLAAAQNYTNYGDKMANLNITGGAIQAQKIKDLNEFNQGLISTGANAISSGAGALGNFFK
jgi:hypothetical protein